MRSPDPQEMPRPCVVELHARGYQRGPRSAKDATALCRMGLRSIFVLSQSASSSVKLQGARSWTHKVWFTALLAANVITTAHGRGINVRTLRQALIANCQSAIGNVLTVALELY